MQIPAGLIGCEVWRVSFDAQTRLLLVGKNPEGTTRVQADLVIETAFTLQDSVGVTHYLDPSTSRSALAPAIDLLFQSVTGLAVEGLGSLTLTFGDGSQLTVHPHDQYESWELYCEGISGILAGPGGETGWMNQQANHTRIIPDALAIASRGRGHCRIEPK